MPVVPLDSPAVIVLVAILFVALISVVTKWIILPLLGINWPFRRVSVPWRFSLQSITILVAVSAVVLGLLRDSLDASLLALGFLGVVWLSVVRYRAFRRSVSDRSQRELTTLLNQMNQAEVGDRSQK